MDLVGLLEIFGFGGSSKKNMSVFGGSSCAFGGSFQIKVLFVGPHVC
jgi:hypothetical protein